MDGMPYISQPPVAPGGKFVYEFTLNQAGTFFYHSHGAMQEMMGMIGMFVIHPAKLWAPQVDHDFGIVMQEWRPCRTTTCQIRRTWNSTGDLQRQSGSGYDADRGSARQPGRVRLVNMGMDHHPIHLHGNTFAVTGSEGGRQPEATWGPANTCWLVWRSARHRVCGVKSRRLDAALPFATPHDEQYVRPHGGSHDDTMRLDGSMRSL